MKMSKIFILFVISLLLVSCQTSHRYCGSPSDRMVVALSWYQNSAEMVALYHQGFNIARERLDEGLAAGGFVKSPAVVVDIDETMLDNSPFETRIVKGTAAPGSWETWTDEVCAKALPGALDFARYAESRGVEIFYITNRDDRDRAATIENLKKEGFPYVTEKNLLTRSDTAFSTGSTSSKLGRRARVSETHEILLLMGDNLNDFSEVFEDRSNKYGKDAIEKYRSEFGRKFIILPNPMYGAWEKPLIDYQRQLDEYKKLELMKSKLN